MFPSSSQWVPIRFPIFSPRVFPMAPRFNPICFVWSPPLLASLGGPKGEALHLSIEFSILGSLHSFNFFLNMWIWILNHTYEMKLSACRLHVLPYFHNHSNSQKQPSWNNTLAKQMASNAAWFPHDIYFDHNLPQYGKILPFFGHTLWALK